MDDFSPLGEPSTLIHLGNSLANACTVAWHYHLHQCQPCTWESQVDWVQSQQASGWSQRPLLLSLSEHQIFQMFQDQLHSSCVWWLVIPVWGDVYRTTVATPTSSQWGSSSVPTSLTFFCLPSLLWYLGALSLGPLCPLWHLGFQCPFFRHPWHMSSHAGHEDWPGGWDFVQCPHKCTLSAGGFLPWWGLLCFLMALDCLLFLQSHGPKVVWDSNVCLAHFEHLGCGCLQVKCKQLLDEFLVI